MALKHVVKRMHARSSRNTQSLMFRLAKITRFSFFGIWGPFLAPCLDWSPGIRGIVGPEMSIPDEPNRKTTTIWIAVPYHRAFIGLRSEISRLTDVWAPSLAELFGIDYKVRVAWSKGGRPLQSELRLASCRLDLGGW